MTLQRESAERRQPRYVVDRAYVARGEVLVTAFDTATRNPTELHNRRPWASGLQRPEVSAPLMLKVLADQRGREMARSGHAKNVALVQAPRESMGIPEERTSRMGPIQPAWSDPAASVS